MSTFAKLAVVTVYCGNPEHMRPIDGHEITRRSSGVPEYARVTYGKFVQPPSPDIKAGMDPEIPMPGMTVIQCYRSPKCKLNVQIGRAKLRSFLDWIAAHHDVTYWRMTAPQLEAVSTHPERWGEALAQSLALGLACRDATSSNLRTSI